jgi:ketosteroid isomerase-like protein
MRSGSQQGSVIANITCGVLVSLFGCHADREHASGTLVSDEATIRSEADAWSQAISSKDLDRTLSFYADDAIYMGAGRPAADTPEKRRELWVNDYALPGFSSKETTQKIEVARSGDLAYQTGKYELTLIDQSGKTVESTGKFLVMWKKQADGNWKAIVDIDNSDQ